MADLEQPVQITAGQKLVEVLSLTRNEYDGYPKYPNFSYVRELAMN